MTRAWPVLLFTLACGPTGFDDATLREEDLGQEEALRLVNGWRSEAGLPPVLASPELHLSAGRHGAYYLQNADLRASAASISNHAEEPWWPGYTGSTPWERAWAAGFDETTAGGEVLHYVGNARKATEGWLNSVYHRIPLLQPDTTHAGFASLTLGEDAVDVMEFGYELNQGADTIVAWPPDRGTHVPLAFDGLERPLPPAPPAGFPSSFPISLTFTSFVAKELRVLRSVVTVNGAEAPTVVLDPSRDSNLHDAVFLYANVPFPPDAEVHVSLALLLNGQELTREWSFHTCLDPATATAGCAD